MLCTNAIQQYSIANFEFNNGRVLSELTLGYTTIGNPIGEPVLLLHGTLGTLQDFFKESFANYLFGVSQSLDLEKYYIIIPDAIGLGSSSKPSNGLKADFPSYDYDDMVRAQHSLVAEGLGIQHLRLIIGISMGGMHAWMWGYKYPLFMDAIVPMAASPLPMSGRNWLMRRFIIDSIRRDPSWNGGQYEVQPEGLVHAYTYFNFIANGGLLRLQELVPTAEAGDRLIEQQLSLPFIGDANDHLFRWEASRNYNPEPYFDQITTRILVVVSADDERNPIQLGSLQSAVEKLARCDLYIIPATIETVGHSTTANAKWWHQRLADFINSI